jgi:MOSC domain-containing protein YiiM
LHSTAKKDPTRPNLRQVLLVDTSILAEIARQNIHLKPGMLGENITLDGITVMTLPIGTQLEVGETLLEVTEVRNPCYQLNEMHPRLLKAVVSKVDGQVRRNAGGMARILKGGWVRPGDPVIVRGEPGML